MSSTMRRTFGATLAGAAMLGSGMGLGTPAAEFTGTGILGPAAAHAQEVTLRRQANRGWIGISYNVSARTTPDGEVEVTAIVSEVSEDGPAARAGLAAGDTILEVNGRPVMGSTFADLALEPGDPLELLIRRDGGERTFELRADERPAGLDRLRIPAEVVVRVDSISSAIFRSLADSGSVGFVSTGPGARIVFLGDSAVRRNAADSVIGAQHLFIPPPMVRLAPLDSAGGRVSTWTLAPSFWPDRQPFHAFVLRSEHTVSIMEDMVELRSELEQLRRAELRRQRALADEMEEEQRRIDQNDPDLQRLRGEQAALRERLEDLEEKLAEASRRELLRRRSDPGERRLIIAPRADSTDRGAVAGTYRVRFPAPHVVGQSVVAGAQLVPLNEGLARYFQTDRGLLVAEVVPGSPAGEAGLEAGDVVTEMSGEPVSSIEELRRMLAGRDGSLVLTVIRKGDSLELELRD